MPTKETVANRRAFLSKSCHGIPEIHSEEKWKTESSPFNIVIAEICQNKCLHYFGQKHHRGPETITQSGQEASTSIHNLQQGETVSNIIFCLHPAGKNKAHAGMIF